MTTRIATASSRCLRSPALWNAWIAITAAWAKLDHAAKAIRLRFADGLRTARLAGCGKIRCYQHTELAHDVFSDRNEDEESAYSAVGTNDRAVGEGREPFLDLLGSCRDTTPHTFPAGIAVARFRMRTRL